MVGTFWGKKSLKALSNKVFRFIQQALGRIPRDTEIWQYPKDKKLVIVTKDADFSDRLMLDFSPPKVVQKCYSVVG